MIFITGATGLVGSQLLFDLLSKEEKVLTLKTKNSDTNRLANIFSSHNELFNKNIEWVKGDILDIFSLKEIFKKGVTKVYHCAGIVSFNKTDAEIMMRTNINGTANIVSLCVENNIEKLCYVSSVSAINRINEDETINELEAKAAAIFG
ncbi:MAG: NAD-dependent epimerase/dehydratase family protein, partial [Parafilimonas sp.]